MSSAASSSSLSSSSHPLPHVSDPLQSMSLLALADKDFSSNTAGSNTHAHSARRRSRGTAQPQGENRKEGVSTASSVADPNMSDLPLVAPSHPQASSKYIRGVKSSIDAEYEQETQSQQNDTDDTQVAPTIQLVDGRVLSPAQSTQPVHAHTAMVDAAYSAAAAPSGLNQSQMQSPRSPDSVLSSLDSSADLLFLSPVPCPSSFHAISHFVLRFVSLGFLLFCALIRTNVFGFCYLILFFFSVGVIAFKQFQHTPMHPLVSASSNSYSPVLSPLLPFVLPGFVLSGVGLLAIAAIQLARRFQINSPLESDILIKFGMSYTEDGINGQNISVLFVPYFVALVYFLGCLLYIRWKDRMWASVNRSRAEKQEEENKQLKEFQSKNLDGPLKALDKSKKEKRSTRSPTSSDHRSAREAKIRSRYATLLALYLKRSKTERRNIAALHQPSVKWAWFEWKMFHPLLHVLVCTLLLPIGLLQRSVISYIYFATWSFLITKWSLWDRKPTNLPVVASDEDPTDATGNSHPLPRNTDKVNGVRVEEIELVERKSSASSSLDRPAAFRAKQPPPIQIKDNGDSDTSVLRPASIPMSFSLFYSFPTYASFPAVSAHLSLFRLYQVMWLYSTFHLLLKYIVRFVYIFDIASSLSALSDLRTPESAAHSHILFFIGEYAIPPNASGSRNMWAEEGAQIILLLIFNMYMSLILHLSRKPFVFLPKHIGRILFDASAQLKFENEQVEPSPALPDKTAQKVLELPFAASAQASAPANSPSKPGVNVSDSVSSPASSLSMMSAPAALQATSPPTTFSPTRVEVNSAGAVLDTGLATATAPVVPSASAAAAIRFSAFEHFATFVGRSLWVFLPISCFMLAILYTSYPGLAFLIAMFLSAYFSLSVSIHLLPFLMLYTQGINHTYYLFHLVNNYWDDVTGAEYLTNFTIPVFVALLLASIAVGYFAIAHRYAHAAILFWEAVHGFAAASLINCPPGASPLGLLSPRLGHHEKQMKSHEREVAALLERWREEDERKAREADAHQAELERQAKEFRRKQKLRRERLRKSKQSEMEELQREQEELALVARAGRRQSKSSLNRGNDVGVSPNRESRQTSPLPVDATTHPVKQVAIESKPKQSAAPPAQSSDSSVSSAPDVTFHASASSPEAAEFSPVRIHMDDEAKSSPVPTAAATSVSAVDMRALSTTMASIAASARPSQVSLMPIVLSPASFETIPSTTPEAFGSPDEAAQRAQQKLAQHSGFATEEEYAAALIQAAFRGKKERRALEKEGVRVVPPEEQQQRYKSQQAHQRRHHHHVHHHKREESQEGGEGSSRWRQFVAYMKRGWHASTSRAATVALFMFSYSNLLVMILLYILGILRVDIIHAVYMLLFLLYAISPWMRRHPGIVVVYSTSVICIQYLWSLAVFNDESQFHTDWTDRVGLVAMMPFNRDIYPHVAILILSGCFHRFSPEEAAQAQLQLNQLDEEAKQAKKAGTLPPTQTAEQTAEYLNRTAYATYWYSPYQPYYRSLVTCGLLLCTAITLWAGLVNSLMTAATVNESASVSSTSSSVVSARDIGVSIISSIYLLFVFAIVLVHQLRPGINAYPYDRVLLFMLCIYSAGIVCLQYVYQFGVLDSSMVSLYDYTSQRFGPTEIGVFKTPGSLYRSLLSHSIVLFVCVALLRILRMDSDPVTGKSISLTCSRNGSVENLLEYLEDILDDCEKDLKQHEIKRMADKRQKDVEAREAALLQKRKLEAFQSNDMTALNAELDREYATEQEYKKKKKYKNKKKLSDKDRTRSMPLTLLMHFFVRLLYYALLFCDWFLLQHTDKILALTLFLVSITHINLMGAWYLLLAFLTLLMMGSPRFKSLLIIISSQLFILICFVWQFPASAFDQTDSIFRVIGLNKDSSFGHVAFHHIAVMFVTAFYGSSYWWLRVHQKKTMMQNQLDEFEAYQENAMLQRKEMEMNQKDTESEPVDVLNKSADEIHTDAAETELPSTPQVRSRQPSKLGAPSNALLVSTPLPPTPDPNRDSGLELQLTRRNGANGLPTNGLATDGANSSSVRNTPLKRSQLHTTSPLRLTDSTSEVIPALLSTLPHPTVEAASVATSPSYLTPSQHSSVVLYTHLENRLYHSQYAADHAHPASRKDDIIQNIQNMNLDVLMQSNVGPSDRKGKPRYERPAIAAAAVRRASLSPVRNIRTLRSTDDSAPSVAPLDSNPTGENTDSDDDEDALTHVKSWMMTVPLSENSHRLSREKKLHKKMQQKLHQQRQQNNQILDASPVVANAPVPINSPPAWPMTAIPEDHSVSPPAVITNLVAVATEPIAKPDANMLGESVDASPAPLFESPVGLNAEAKTFALASSAVRLNQFDPISKHFEAHLKRHTSKTGDEDDDIPSESVADPEAVGLDSAIVDGDGGAHMNASLYHRFIRGLLGDDGFMVFCSRFLHYFGFFHLALMALLCASYSNANTIFSLYYICVSGLLSYVGTQTANRYWRPLVATLTLCIMAKYAVAIANLTPRYGCDYGLTTRGFTCDRWVIWLGKGTTMYYWDAVAWLMVVIHYSFLRIYAKIEKQMEERKRIEMEEPWELKNGGRFNNPIEKAAYDGATEGAIETFRFRPTAMSNGPSALTNVGNDSAAATLIANMHQTLLTKEPKQMNSTTPRYYHRFSPSVQFPAFQFASQKFKATDPFIESDEILTAKQVRSKPKASNDLPGLFQQPSPINLGQASPSLSEDGSVVSTIVVNPFISPQPLPLSPSGYPSYRPKLSELDPVPSYITVTYTTINNQLSSYLISNFMTANNINSSQNTVSDFMHFVVFRASFYVAMIIIICMATTYFNMLSFIYLGICLYLLWEGDRVLDGTKQFLLDYFYVFTFGVLTLRLLYQLPVFHLTRVVTNWSTVIGFYKTTMDDCLYGIDYAFLSQCETTPYTGLLPNVLVIDILIFGVILIMRTLLARKEMVFVRHEIRLQRKVGNVRSELIALQIEHDRLIRTHKEQREAIRRLQRVNLLKEIKIERELRLERERVLSGQNHIIEGWEGAGVQMGVPPSRKPPGEDEDAMARASIRNHAISQLKHDPHSLPFRSKAVDAPLPNIGNESEALRTHARERRRAAREARKAGKSKQQITPLIYNQSASADLETTSVPEEGVDELDDDLDDEGVLRARKPESSIGTSRAVKDDESDDDTSKPLLNSQNSTNESIAPHHHHHSHPHSNVEQLEDPVTLQSQLRSTIFEIRLVEDRMRRLRKKKSIESLNKGDELPLLLQKFYELSWVRSFQSIFTSSKHTIFKEDRMDSIIDDRMQSAENNPGAVHSPTSKSTTSEKLDQLQQPAFTVVDPVAAQTTVTVPPKAVPHPAVLSPVARATASDDTDLVHSVGANTFAANIRRALSPNHVSSSKDVEMEEIPPARYAAPSAPPQQTVQPKVEPLTAAIDAVSSVKVSEPTVIVSSDMLKLDGSATTLASINRSTEPDSDDDDLHDPDPSLVAQVWELLSSLILNSTWFLVCFFFLLEYLVQPSLLSVIYPFSLFLYGLLTYPRPPRWFWEAMMIYTSLLIVLKFLFQFPCFCICNTIYGESYSLCALADSISCSVTSFGIRIPSSSTSLQNIIGLTKVVSRDLAQSGQGMKFVGGVILDFFTLLILYFHRRYLRIHGLWLNNADIELRKQQHERLMAKLVRTAVMKEKMRKWQEDHPGEVQREPTLVAPSKRKSSLSGEDRLMQKKSDKFQRRESLKRTKSISSESQSEAEARGPIFFAPATKSSNIEVQISHVSPSLPTAQQPVLPRKSASASPTRPPTAKERREMAWQEASSRSLVLAPQAQTKRKPRVKRMMSMPNVGSDAIATSNRITSRPSINPIMRDPMPVIPSSNSSSAISSAENSDSGAPIHEIVPAPRSRPSLILRMSQLLTQGKSKLLQVIGEPAPESPVESGTDLEAGESKKLLGNKKHSTSAATVADTHAREKARRQQRELLAKQAAKEKSVQFQRSLRRMSVAERQDALTQAHKLEKKEKSREKRRKERAKVRAAEKAAHHRQQEKGNWLVEKSKWVVVSLSDTRYKPGKDFYIYIFLVQLIQFLVLVIFYNLSDNAGSISQNYISPQFVLVIFAQFVHIVLERVIYLYRQLFLKVLLQLATMITFFVISLYVGLGANALLNVVYVLMCFYWVLSSLQFYHGFPASTHGQFLAKSTHWLPSTLFILYRAIPFVFELRTLLDWLCTDTVLYFGEWLKFEDIYATFFLTQCKCDGKRNNPKHAGTKQPLWSKLLIGLGLFILLIIVVWGPLFLFSSQSATHPNPVISTQVTVNLPGYYPLYSSTQSYVVASEGSADQEDVKIDQFLTNDQYAELVSTHSYLGSLRQRDLQIIYPLGTASSIWSITPLSRVNLIKHLSDSLTPQKLEFSFTFTRSSATASPTTNFPQSYTLSQDQMNTLARILNGTAVATFNQTDPVGSSSSSSSSSSTGVSGEIPPQQLRRRRLLQIIGNDTSSSSSSTGLDSSFNSSSSTGSAAGTNSNVSSSIASGANLTSSLFLPNCYPAFFFMSSTDSSGAVQPLSTDAASKVNCLLTLVSNSDRFGNKQEWWVLSDAGNLPQVSAVTALAASDTALPSLLTSPNYASNYDGISLGPPIYMYSGEIPSGNSLNYGLVGVYVTVVLTIGRFLRMYVMGTSKSIMWDDVQDALPILNMCRDLYTARLHLQLKLEQQLYVELINLLRSPETLFIRTGEYIHYWPKEETTSEEDLPDDSDDDSDDSDQSWSSYSTSSSPESDYERSKEEETTDTANAVPTIAALPTSVTLPTNTQA